jgi:hypothetical protein
MNIYAKHNEIYVYRNLRLKKYYTDVQLITITSKIIHCHYNLIVEITRLSPSDQNRTVSSRKTFKKL